MKILLLRLKNLNSLRGPVEIDFTRPPFTAANLFAITGPTGSGKTTLLDAITLALYGKVARYGNESNPENIMSRHTGDCRAEVEFSCSGGQFRAVWERRRAYGRADGQMQPPKRVLARLPQGEILAEKQGEVQVQIDSLTGLDYERFLRAVLLAQGEFSAFLRAPATERSAILQKITGTSLYQEISRASYQRWDESRQACETIRTQLTALQPAEEPRLDVLVHQLEATQQEQTTLRQAVQALTERLALARRRREIEEEMRRRQSEEAEWKRACEQASPALAKLAAHERVWPLTPQFTRWETLQQTIQTREKRLSEIESALPPKQLAQQVARMAVLQAEESLAAEELHHRELLTLWEEVLLCDQEIQTAQQACSHARDRTLSAQREDQQLRSEQDRDLAAEQVLAAELAQLEPWLAEHEGDRALGQLLPDLEHSHQLWESARHQAEKPRQAIPLLSLQLEKLAAAVRQQESRLLEARKDREQLQTALDQTSGEIQQLLGPLDLASWDQQRQTAQHRLIGLTTAVERRTLVSHCRELIKENQQKCSVVNQTLATCQDKLAREEVLQRETEKTALACEEALLFAEKIQSLEEQRHSLRAGHPCPLCGATEHPFVSSEIIGQDSLARVRRNAVQARHLAKEKELTLQSLGKEIAVLQATALSLQAEAEKHTRAETSAWLEWKTCAARCALPEEIGEEELSHLHQLAQTTVESGQVTWQRLQVVVARERRETADLARTDKALQETSEKLHQAQLASAQAAEKLHQEETNLSRAEAEAATRLVALDRLLSPWVADWIQTQPSALDQLRQRLQVFTTKSARSVVVHSNREILQERLQRYARQLQTSAELLERARENESRAGEILLRHRTRRFQLYADHDVNKARVQISRKLDNLRKAREAQAEKLVQIAQEVRLLEGEAERCQLERQSLGTDLENLLAAFLPLIEKAGFSDLAAARSALLTTPEISELHDLRNRLEETRIRLLSREHELQLQTQALPSSAAADAALVEELTRRQRETEAALQAATKQIGVLQEALRREEKLRQTRVDLTSQLTHLEKEQQRWWALKQLIGQADGQLFARFAQTLTMERLALLASRHLHQLSPRYRLQRQAEEDDADSLDLVVTDLYQGSVSRPLRSLSGGETFLVSLALALGLSELARGQAAIESLFIDEGFGFLDETTLDSAMQALENIHAGGRTIGIISHLASLRDRLPTQIRICRQPDGTSSVEVTGMGEH